MNERQNAILRTGFSKLAQLINDGAPHWLLRRHVTNVQEALERES